MHIFQVIDVWPADSEFDLYFQSNPILVQCTYTPKTMAKTYP